MEANDSSRDRARSNLDSDDLDRARESLMLRLKCLHCFKTYEDPRRLPCGHVFCLRCIESVHSASFRLGAFARHRTTTSYARRSAGHFLCPACNGIVSVPAQGLAWLPRAQSADDARQSAIDEFSRLLEIKYRRRTTGNIPHDARRSHGECANASGFAPRETRSKIDLLVEEDENFACNEARGANRHSYPSARLGSNKDDIINGNNNNNDNDDTDDVCNVVGNRDSASRDYESRPGAGGKGPVWEEEEEEDEVPIKGGYRDELPRLERIRRSRRGTRNLRSNLRPTSEYSDVSPRNCTVEEGRREDKEQEEHEPQVTEFTEVIEVAGGGSLSSGLNQGATGPWEEMAYNSGRRGRLTGSHSFSTLDQNKSYVSTARRCFSLRDKIRRDPVHHSSDVFDAKTFEAASRLSTSSIPSSCRSSFDSRKQFSSSFDSTAGGAPSSLSDVGPSTDAGPKVQSSRYKSAPENFFSFKTHFPVIEETSKFRNLPGQPASRKYSNGSRFASNLGGIPQEEDAPKETKRVTFSEEEVKERLSKYREASKNSGTAELIRVSDELFCLPSAISCLSDRCLAVADHGCNSVLLFDASWTPTKRISGIKPFGLAYSDASGLLYVADRRSRTVLVYDAVTGDRKHSWAADSFGWICGLEVISETGSAEQVAVLDRSSSSVKICDVRTGSLVRQFGSYGNDDDQFCMAEFLAWDPRRERLLVSDSGNHRIVAFDPRQGAPCFAFGQRGCGDDGHFQWPKGVCVDRKGNIYVADSGNRRISLFTADGCFVEHVISPIVAPYTVAVEENSEPTSGRSEDGTFLNLTTFSLQSKAQLFRYSI